MNWGTPYGHIPWISQWWTSEAQELLSRLEAEDFLRELETEEDA
jgi:hypothetical protein